MPHTADTVRHVATVLQERYELALGLGIALDVALRHGETRMARELLHVPETAPDLRHSACSTRNKGAAPRMGRTAIHLQRPIEPMEPQAYGRGRQPSTPLREEDRPLGGSHVRTRGLQRDQRRLEVGVQRNGTAAR